MRIGVFYFPTDYGIDIRELARAAEERGFESLLLPEHTHIPMSRRTPYPGGGELPKAYSHTHDPFVALSFAAAATTKILLGTGICLIPQRDPDRDGEVAWLVWINCPTGGFFSVLAVAGMSMKWRITELATRRASS